MNEKPDSCPMCGSDSYDTIKHSWRDGLPPFDDYYECCSCDHTWTAKDTEENQACVK